MMGSEGISVADAIALGRGNNGYGDGDGAFGGNGAWWVIILILFFAVGGWGNRGFGNNGGNDGNGGDSERMYDGLEKLMYAICMFIESTMDFAESPEEKEIIRKHIQKLKNI